MPALNHGSPLAPRVSSGTSTFPLSARTPPRESNAEVPPILNLSTQLKYQLQPAPAIPSRSPTSSAVMTGCTWHALMLNCAVTAPYSRWSAPRN